MNSNPKNSKLKMKQTNADKLKVEIRYIIDLTGLFEKETEDPRTRIKIHKKLWKFSIIKYKKCDKRVC